MAVRVITGRFTIAALLVLMVVVTWYGASLRGPQTASVADGSCTSDGYRIYNVGIPIQDAWATGSESANVPAGATLSLSGDGYCKRTCDAELQTNPNAECEPGSCSIAGSCSPNCFPAAGGGDYCFIFDTPLDDNDGSCSGTYSVYDPTCFGGTNGSGGGDGGGGGSSSFASNTSASSSTSSTSVSTSSVSSHSTSSISSQTSSTSHSSTSSVSSYISSVSSFHSSTSTSTFSSSSWSSTSSTFSSSSTSTTSSAGTSSTSTSITPTASSSSTGITPNGQCGDGVVDPGEQCDDGNQIDNDACDNTCVGVGVGQCGDGVVDQGEQCDDGNQIDNDACDNTCNAGLPGQCGNGIVDPGEECDDGNTNNVDACDNACTIPGGGGGPQCGDGVVDPGEQCDDGNQNDADACNNQCQTVIGGQCTGNECANGGDAFCAQTNETCSAVGQMPCIQCLPIIGGQCTGNECAEGGDAAAAAQGMECSLIPDFPCVAFIPPNSCGNGQIDPLNPPEIDEGCYVTGASNQLCLPEGATPDETGMFLPWFECFHTANCVTMGDTCGWEQTPALQSCLESKNAGTPSSGAQAAPVAQGNLCVRTGCFGEICSSVLADSISPEHCPFAPEVSCYDDAICEWNGAGCAWRDTPELQQCLNDNAGGDCASGQSCLSVSACGAAGGSIGSTCGVSGTNVCCSMSDEPMEQCDDGNQVDDDACSNTCTINCTTDADCPEGACVDGTCTNQCVVPVAQVPLHEASPPPARTDVFTRLTAWKWSDPFTLLP